MKKLLALSALLAALPSLALACACGCGVFDVGTSTMLPTQPGGMMWLEYDYMDQTHNWNGAHRNDASENDDKRIRNSFVTLGGQYMFDRSWGVEATVPYTDRMFRNSDAGPIETFNHAAFGDVHLQAIYSGFEPDMSTGLTFGLKLPTGDYKYANFDRDVETGTGSTDILLGGYHVGPLAKSFDWFADAQFDQAVLIQQQYRPGHELDASLGTYYNGFTVGNTKVAPLLQLIGSVRSHDLGANSDPENTGYDRVMISPGVEVDTVDGTRLYADVAFPVYQHVNGNQLVAPVYFKLNIGHTF
ncbi:MAG: hypothetical protein WDN72_04295 [Alphaproteobacteria bacterium]